MNSYCIFASTLLISFSAHASVINLEQFGLYIQSDNLLEALIDERLYDSLQSNYIDSGFSLTSEDRFSSENLGSYSWSVKNNSNSKINDLMITGFLDASIDYHENTFFNESATYIGNTDAIRHEADEPGYIFGDIYENVLLGSLDGQNEVQPGSEDDVALALGFSLDAFDIGDALNLTIEISESDIGGFYQYDADSDYGFWFNAYFSYIPKIVNSDVSEPSPLSLFLVGMFGLVFLRKTQIK
jgi:hypothetical protein